MRFLVVLAVWSPGQRHQQHLLETRGLSSPADAGARGVGTGRCANKPSRASDDTEAENHGPGPHAQTGLSPAISWGACGTPGLRPRRIGVRAGDLASLDLGVAVLTSALFSSWDSV